MSALLEARGLVKALGGRRVVDGVDLDCAAGQVRGLLGPNGAGKTTTLRMLYGFLRPDAGAIRFDGVDVGGHVERIKRALGVCTQDDTFDGDFSVEQNLWMAARYFRPRPQGVAARVRELLERFDLGQYARSRPETLSGGFKRRLAPLRAASPLYHLAETARGLLLGGSIAYHLTALLAMSVAIVLILVPLDLCLLRRRVLGER
jgi:lipooligosaccharide transport system ATP-binding protein